jgi:hypothetical protein
MSVSQDSERDHRGQDEPLLPLTIIGLILALIAMGWSVVTHVRPNMPHPVSVNDTAPAQKGA